MPQCHLRPEIKMQVYTKPVSWRFWGFDIAKPGASCEKLKSSFMRAGVEVRPKKQLYAS